MPPTVPGDASTKTGVNRRRLPSQVARSTSKPVLLPESDCVPHPGSRLVTAMLTTEAKAGCDGSLLGESLPSMGYTSAATATNTTVTPAASDPHSRRSPPTGADLGR